jgi:hypothetical protein
MADRYALWILDARIFQSAVHMASTSIPAVYLRFMFYGVQIVLLTLIAVKAFGG